MGGDTPVLSVGNLTEQAELWESNSMRLEAEQGQWVVLFEFLMALGHNRLLIHCSKERNTFHLDHLCVPLHWGTLCPTQEPKPTSPAERKN